jgi:hypothetical protein
VPELEPVPALEPEPVPDGSAEHDEPAPLSGVALVVLTVGLVVVVAGAEVVDVVVGLVGVGLAVVLGSEVVEVVVGLVAVGGLELGAVVVADGVELVVVVIAGVELVGVVVSELVAGQPAVPVPGVVAAGVFDPASTVASV